jgi:hypothetical protein
MFIRSIVAYVVAVAVVLCFVSCVYATEGMGAGVGAGQNIAAAFREPADEFSVGVVALHTDIDRDTKAIARIGLVDIEHLMSYQHPSPGSRQLSDLHYTVLATIPHDETCFSQGIQYFTHTPTAATPGTTVLYESCGLYGKSNVRIVDPHTGTCVCACACMYIPYTIFIVMCPTVQVWLHT